MNSQESFVIKLFREAAERVPAYKDFLRKHKIKPDTVQTIEDFKNIPLIDKKNYLSQYSLPELSWDGQLFNSQMISVSSGSSGQPLFWPRGEEQDKEGAWMHEQIYRDIFRVDKYKTLTLVCFSMGTWIAGSFTASSTVQVARKGYPVNIVTPGLELEEAIKTIKKLGHLYDQIVLAGYPPFIKDVIDMGISEGIKWKKYKLRFLWAGEAFSEEWRDYVLKLVGVNIPFYSTVNVYGTADAAMVAHETPVSILVRRIYNQKPELARSVFQDSILPSISQYYPNRRYFECTDGELIFSAYAGIPLIRYNIHDAGGVYDFKDLIKPIEKQFYKQTAQYKVDTKRWKLPFVYLNGRKDFTVTIYAVNIYPENIKAALVDPRMRSWVTGRFSMATRYKSDMDQYFEINIELAKGVKAENGYQLVAKTVILSKLMKLNAEFHKLYSAVNERAEPRIHLIKYGDKNHFARGTNKQRWIKKDK